MGHLSTLARRSLATSGARYLVAGGLVAIVYFGIPATLTGELHVAIQISIPISYVAAVTLHFNLQRHFVFRHVEEFALSRRQQIMRYVMMGAIQYPATAGLTALLPSLLGLSDLATFLLVSGTISLIVFVVLRTHIFHATGHDDPEGLGDQLKTAELEILGASRDNRTMSGDPEPQRGR